MSRWNNVNDRHERALHASAQRLLDDSRHDRLRTRSGLLAVLAVYVAATVILATLWLAFGSAGGIVGIAVWALAFVVLRRAVRSQADLPDEVLDERMRAERDRAYLDAFRGVAGIVVVAALIALGATTIGEPPATVTINENQVNAGFWVLLSIVLGAPSVALAYRHRLRLRTERPEQ
jgi:hypothetical protein